VDIRRLKGNDCRASVTPKLKASCPGGTSAPAAAYPIEIVNLMVERTTICLSTIIFSEGIWICVTMLELVALVGANDCAVF